MKRFRIAATVTVDVELIVKASSKEDAATRFEDQLAMSAFLIEGQEGVDWWANEDCISDIDLNAVEMEGDQ